MAARATTAGFPKGAEGSLDERARRVLAAIVRDYIHNGEPVGSHAIARRADVDVSSATVRSVMSDLEEMGFLQKPHTSAGRIPTAHGFRYYVDALLRVKPPLPEEREQIARRAHEATQLEGLMTAASRVLHSLTHHAGVVASPRPQSERLQRIEFLQLREGRLLAVLVARSGAVRNRLVALPQPLSPAQLDEAAGYLNSLIADRTLAEAASKLSEEMERDRRELGELRARALALGAEAVQVEAPAVHIEGQSSLLEDKALAHDLDKIRALFRALDEKERLLAVLDRTLAAQELRIFIGAESGIVEPDLAIVAAPYRLKGEVVGALGVIGPTRMDYSRVVPLVELTARTVGLTLDGTEEE
ncbi:MAG: heat-inducible transcription repressor HrcA [Deltaproteobacteria bacterium]|nr:MAG: heat-inducible transcription repressor HrcA [Deltaproteobacteria bacterium]